jgi:hypothetical protein
MSRPPVILAALVCLAAALARSDEPPPAPPQPAEQQLQAVLSAIPHLGTQRPEGIVAILAISVPRDHVLTPEDFFNLDPRKQGSYAAAGVIGVRSAPAAAALLRHGFNNGIFIFEEAAAASRRVRDPKIDRERIAGIEDHKDIPGVDQNPHEYRSYCYLLAHAHEVPLAALAKAGNPKVTYMHLMEQPDRYRGEIVPMAGTLRQVRELPAPRGVWNDGIRVIYEVLIDSGVYYAYPVNPRTGKQETEMRAMAWYVVLTELPPGVQVGDKLDVSVTCDAYFYKLFFIDKNPKQVVGRPREKPRQPVPLLIGRSLVVRKAASDELTVGLGWGSPVTMVITGLTVMAVFVAMIIFWFRRGDRSVQTRIRQARGVEWVEPSDDGTAETTAEEPSSIQNPPAG